MKQISSKIRGPRTGTSMVEVLVAAAMLLVVMSFVSTAIYRIDLVWRDTARQRAALNELSNQLEQLTLLSPEQLPAAIESLAPTRMIGETLPGAQLSGELIEDSLGTRVVLRLDWHRKHPGNPVELAGWVTHLDASSANGEPATEVEP